MTVAQALPSVDVHARALPRAFGRRVAPVNSSLAALAILTRRAPGDFLDSRHGHVDIHPGHASIRIASTARAGRDTRGPAALPGEGAEARPGRELAVVVVRSAVRP